MDGPESCRGLLASSQNRAEKQDQEGPGLRKNQAVRSWVQAGLALFLFALPPARAEEAALSIDGSNTLRSEHYINKGDQASSPFPFEDTHTFDELSLRMLHRPSPFALTRGQFFGVYNESDYRSEFREFSVERWNLLQERGGVFLPYRAEVGDYFSFLSQRTQSRTLKGAQIEVQPGFEGIGHNHSFLLFTGANQPSWRQFEADEDYSAGASWLLENALLGHWSFNHVYSTRESNAFGLPRREQHVLSLAFEKGFLLAGQTLTLEGEAAHFTGDHDGSAGAESGQENDENSFFAQISGQSAIPLNYRFRFEHSGEDFRPNGAIVSPDRQSYEAHLGWRFDSGLQLRTRYQLFQDSLESVNRTDTDVIGLNLSGPLLRRWFDDLTGNMDNFLRFTENRDGTVDSRNTVFNWNVNKPIPWDWNLRVGTFLQEVNNLTPAAEPVYTYQLSLNADHAISLLGLNGSVSPGLVLRRVRGGQADTDDLSPTFSTFLNRGAHSFGLSAGYQSQQRDTLNSIDLDTYTVSSTYGYNRGAHSLGFEFSYSGRHPNRGSDADGYQFALFWTYNFGTTVTRETFQPRPRPGPAEALAPDLRVLAALAPGLAFEDAAERLERIGITARTDLPGVSVYEVRLLEEIGQRQRLALLRDDAGIIRKTGLIIDFDDVGNLDSTAQTFDKVRQVLVKVYGRPDTFFEEGEFGPNFADDVNNNRFIRIFEWNLQGSVIRFGIPRRVDRQVRMEIQHAASFPPVRETLWSLNEVR